MVGFGGLMPARVTTGQAWPMGQNLGQRDARTIWPALNGKIRGPNLVAILDGPMRGHFVNFETAMLYSFPKCVQIFTV
ncbi:hypothetical protein Y032_0006g3067 [Ancylostoma ceylanicum]|uniref:Uncharacterized protein n=1 Tax=Ancylostoma ceylanicum TaxID=53326 RepID=A0A016VS85_9BILA|nr:hypothetical protein Y032_0006g3067 [Ancylostoma ceylanicum]